MKITLTPQEVRVIGALIEKEITTPDQYPLSLNALTNACNQRSNREPVLELDETMVQQTVDGLIKKYLVGKNSGFGSRVAKYRHRFCNAEYGDLRLSEQEVGIICELLLRGPQTPGELRLHTERLCKFGDVGEVEATLSGLMERDDPLVARLPREPGRRESRYAHLLGGAEQVREACEGGIGGIVTADSERLESLEQLVCELRQEVDRLKEDYRRLAANIGVLIDTSN